MWYRVASVVALLIFAVGVLTTSVLRATLPEYAFSKTNSTPKPTLQVTEVEYYLAYPGILPDHFLWPAKNLRDNLWLFLTTDPLKKAELYLVLADKRLGAALALADGGKENLAAPTAIEAEKYLQQAVEKETIARQKRADTGQLLDKLAIATLKHRQVLEEIYSQVDEGERSDIASAIDYPKKIFSQLKSVLGALNRAVPPSPFDISE
ncbi:hypothetical protein HY404_02975 [Candidatus Microgenomates bacterium]|nr:hypothetical protein [Candidatus Microgenomates bacterium]